MNCDSFTVVFAGGGTLGHLFAGLAVADALGDFVPATAIHFAGGGAANERRHVEAAGYVYHQVACRPRPRRPWAAGRFLLENARGYLSGRRLLDQLRANAVVGLGGYASAPVARAAVSRSIPLVLVEQNALPGRVNRWLSRYARCVCVSFDSRAVASMPRMYFTGGPVRRGFVSPVRRANDEKLLLITGGSQGAAVFNAAAPEALSQCQPLAAGWRILHQTGNRELEATRERYRRLGIAAEVAAFVDLPSVLPQASLAVCRAGGSTIAELCVSGTPAILCPYPYASDDHQRHNAAAVADGCRVVYERLPDFVGRLKAELSVLMASAERRWELSQALLRRARPRAARDVAQLVLAAAFDREIVSDRVAEHRACGGVLPAAAGFMPRAF